MSDARSGDLPDVELTKLCAEAMGYEVTVKPVRQGEPSIYVRGDNYSGSADDGRFVYDPLHNDAQAMALLKKFDLICDSPRRYCEQTDWDVTYYGDCSATEINARNTDLNRAIVECVALMQSQANSPARAKLK